MRCLVTGANGFAASHLIDRLIESGHEVHGTVRIRSRPDNIAHCIDKITLHSMCMNDAFGVDHVIKRVMPDMIFHLAAQSFVGWSWNHPAETIQTNVLGTLNLLEAVRRNCPDARVHIASSSQVYGKTDEPMGKDTLFNPMNPYDTSKLAQDMLARQYFNSYGLKIVITRAFNITGARRGDSFAESSWARQIAEIERWGSGVIKHGNLESARDYIDVRDVVCAYEFLGMTGDAGGLYILGSGNPVKMEAILTKLVSYSLEGISIPLEADPARMRPSDTPTMRAKDSCLAEVVAYVENRGLIPIEKSLKDLLNYWREKIS